MILTLSPSAKRRCPVPGHTAPRAPGRVAAVSTVTSRRHSRSENPSTALSCVRHWRGGKMILQWTVAAVADAATHFRRITGACEVMTELMRALARHDISTTATSSRDEVAS